jgi:threonyl-tRNA synthetase
MAQAVTDLWPDAKFAIGPPVADGFYYDFDVDEPFTPDDLERIEQRMRGIVAEAQPFARREVDPEEAKREFADQPYKVELIEQAAGGGAIAGDETADIDPSDERVSVYDNVRADGSRWPDLCRGPHVPTTAWIPAFSLQRVAGAYWRGDETRPMLQRIYGTAWESEEALSAHLQRLEEARQRDHRKLGRELDLISFPEELGPGLEVWHPKGARVRTVMEDYARELHLGRGYEPVFSPHVGRSTLWETSGHLEHYAENMYPAMEFAEEEARYYAKPMNCPFHVLIYGSRTRSYRELPLRLFELGTVYRYERSGTIHGLMRSRVLTQDDSHLFCTPEQITDEIIGIIELARRLYRDFGLGEPSRVALATRPEKAATVGTDEAWAHAESSLRAALDASGLAYQVDEGEGAFYGPKIDMHVTDAIGREWQLTTVQLDFTLPERFDLTYAGSDGAEHRPIMIHRAVYGSIGRFFGVLLEHYAGALPTWLAPVQAVVVPIAERHHDYARDVAARLSARELRVEVDESDAQMGAKIRKHQLAKVPYQLIVGDSEAGAGTVAVRPRRGEQRADVGVDGFAAELAELVAARGADGQAG